jgi:hypothetical protein
LRTKPEKLITPASSIYTIVVRKEWDGIAMEKELKKMEPLHQ